MMKRPFTYALAALKKLGVPTFAQEDHEARGNFAISAEEPESGKWVDYYSQDPSWVFGVHPKLDNLLRKYGLYAEWETPGSLNVYEG